MEGFAAYGYALAALAVFALIVMALAPLTGLSKQRDGVAPGGTPPQDYANPTYRLHRAYGNAAESLPVFLAATLAAILAGVSPAWVNLLASVVVAARLVMLFFHISGIGHPYFGPRSVAYASAVACNAVMAVMTIARVI